MLIRGVVALVTIALKRSQGERGVRPEKEDGNPHVGFSTVVQSVGGDPITTLSLVILYFLIG